MTVDAQLASQDLPARAHPLRPRRLLGREREIAEVTDSVLSSQVTTLIGPGGVGKTSLATTVAATIGREQLAGAVAVVWLAPLRSPELVVAEVAAAVGLTKSGGLSYEEAIIPWLADKDILLVLDNCEHLVAAVADLVDWLTSQLPRLRILATSREPLWVEGEVGHRLSPLDSGSAVQLFRDRVGERHGEALKTERAERAIGEICRRVDGLPLAIELAAARAIGLDLEDITSHLDDLFHLLPRPARRVDGGQRSLRATVEWSDALLAPEERSLLHRMAVFAGGFELAAIHAVCAAPGQSAAQTADLTARLVEKSLLLKLADSGRYQVLETIRQYAMEQLTTAGTIDAVRERHARFYLETALVECQGLMTGWERPHIDALARIEDNVRVALECLIRVAPSDALQLATGLTNFWWMQGKLREGIGWIEQARIAATDAPLELRALGFCCQGFLVAHDTDDWRAAARLLDVGIELLSGVIEPPPVLAMLTCLRGECDVFNGDAPSAVTRTQAALEIVARYPDTWAQALVLWNAAYAKLAVGDANSALALFTECIELCVKNRYGVAEMCACNVVAEIWEARGALEQSRAFWERALRLRLAIGASKMGHVHGTLPLTLLAIARVAAKQGELATTSKLLREALPLAEEMRDDATVQRIVELMKKTSQAKPAQSATLRHEAGVWQIVFNGKSVHVPDMKGFWHLRELVSRPREAVPALSLIAAQSEEPLPISDAGPALDREALKQYRKRLAQLDEELEDAEARQDVARHEERTAERDALIAELSRATGIGGKPRRTGSSTEKARLNVTRTLRHVISYLTSTAPELAAHLDESLVTGACCSYEPHDDIAWST